MCFLPWKEQKAEVSDFTISPELLNALTTLLHLRHEEQVVDFLLLSQRKQFRDNSIFPFETVSFHQAAGPIWT